MITITELSSEYNTTQIVFDYVTKGHYRAYLCHDENSFGIEFIYEEFDCEIEKIFIDILVPSYLDHPKSFAAKLNDQIVGYVVVNHEMYNNRIRIAQLLVIKGFRNMGIGKLLMNHAEDYAKNVGARALILETQSCNLIAISFYRHCGYQFVGCDATCYSNEDIERREVRLELGKAL
ncbi:MAG: GNAT family N-acetyltransferase [Erysipelotrichaceae bacterium]|nr:GNAT family N-acetyltransferase [Erysipelotrichaceae bacterium]